MNRFTKQTRGFCVRWLVIVLLVFLWGCSAATPTADDSPEGEKLVFEHTVVSLTFDDGDADNYLVRPDLQRNNLHATFYVVSSYVGADGYMDEAQLRELYADGNEIGGHTLHHKSLIEIPVGELQQEICQDRLNLLAYGFDVVSFAYPGGSINEAAKSAVRDCGYSNGRVVVEGPESIPPLDAYALRALPYVVDDTRLPKMQRYIREVEEAGGGWAIFIFHHVCDGCDYYAISPRTFSRFADWLGEQQKNGLVVQTVGEVMRRGSR